MSRHLSKLSMPSNRPSPGPSSAKPPTPASAFSPLSARRASGPILSPLLSASASALLSASGSGDNIQHGHDIDPDELFVKHTVAEVKLVQQRLRAEADAKQGELRLMVGERYRDLLQASTSIISIAQSSNRVLEAVEDMKDTVSSEPHRTRRSTHAGKDDARLQALQSLAAHVKLLLDAPEHLWRLIEAKKYFHAAWLFLLARVVYRALSTDDVDEVEWPDLDIMEEFPLVQRQWDTVSHFRSQIGHKATLSLREYHTSPETVCSIVITLHLLDSKPLTETLSTFLAQRSKTAQVLLARKADAAAADVAQTSRPANGVPPDKSIANGERPTKSRKRRAREVKQASEGALTLVSRTLGAARGTFASRSEAEPSLVRRVLNHIQSDSPESSSGSLSPELGLSTQTLLTALPSSSQLLLLPSSLRQYKPYVDIDSSSSTVSTQELADKLGSWFQKTVREVNTALERWLADLESIRQVWAVRRSIRKWLDEASELEEPERKSIRSSLDDVCGRRATSIWSGVLATIASIFRDRLVLAVSDSVFPEQASEDVFKPPPTLLLGYGAPDSSHAVASYERYRSALRHQVEGRTPLLDRVLAAVETPASHLREDLNYMTGDDNDTQGLISHLTRSYDPQAGQLYEQLIATLSDVAEHVPQDAAASMDRILFIGRTGDELALSAAFMAGVGGSDTVQTNFRHKARELYDRTIDRWRRHVVSDVVRRYTEGIGPSVEAVSRPSSAMADGLLCLSTSVHRMGFSKEHNRRRVVAEETLRVFVAELLQSDTIPLIGGHAHAQLLWDLTFVDRIASMWGAGCAKTSARLREKIAQVRENLKTPPAESEMDKSLSAYLSRTQMLIDPLLPPTQSADGALLKHGTPAGEAQFLPAMDLVKPSPRFGLLLVGGSSVS